MSAKQEKAGAAATRDPDVKLVQALAAAQRTALASGALVHGFKNQLTVVLGHAQLALEAIGRGEDPDRDGLAAIHRAATQGVDLSRQLLGLARTDGDGGDEFEPGPVLERVVGLAATMLPGPVQLDIQDDLVPLRGDPLRVEQSLVDLVLNARDALASSYGTVVLGYRRTDVDGHDPRGLRARVPSGRYGILSVSDDGPGMPSHVVERACDLFFTTKEAGAGSGVGLAVVRGIAECVGGGLVIDSVPGEGTTVSMLLPEAPLRRNELEGRALDVAAAV